MKIVQETLHENYLVNNSSSTSKLSPDSGHPSWRHAVSFPQRNRVDPESIINPYNWNNILKLFHIRMVHFYSILWFYIYIKKYDLKEKKLSCSSSRSWSENIFCYALFLVSVPSALQSIILLCQPACFKEQ